MKAPSETSTAAHAIEAAAAGPSPEADAGAARPGLPVLPPLTALLEIVLLVLVPGALDFLVPAFPSLADMQPHPFWLPVLLVSLQYGTVSGLLAAGAAIATSSFLGWSEQEPGENHFAYLLRVWSQPMLWLAAALILGQFRTRQIELKQELARRVSELWNQRQAIADHAGELRERCERLERQIVSRHGAASRDILAAMGRLQPGGDNLPAASEELLTLAFGPCQASVFMLTGNGLMLTGNFGWPGDARWETQLGPDHPLTMLMRSSPRPVSVLVPGDEAILAGEGLVAVPLREPATGRTFGLLKIEAAGPESLDRQAPLRLLAVAGALAPLLDGAGSVPGSSRVSAPATVSAGPPAPKRIWRQVRRLPDQASSNPRRHWRSG